MPATAGRVRMPANNRVHSSAALQTHGIWQSAIGYDPYAPNKDDAKQSTQPQSSNAEPDGENAYASFQGLLALARITGSNADEARGACKKCGRVGHLTFQCRNFLSLKEDNKEKDPIALQAAITSGLDKLKGVESSDESSEEEEESESSDSDVDLEIERIISARMGKKGGSKMRSASKKEVSDEEGLDHGERKQRGRSKKRSSRKRGGGGGGDSDDDDEGGRDKRKEKRRKRHESSDEDEDSDKDDNHRHRHRKSRKEKRTRRSHKDRHQKRKSRRGESPSDSGTSDLDDSRVGRGTKRFEKRSKKHRWQQC